MKGTMGRTGRAFAALALAGALGFGTVQAFAEPATPQSAARLCDKVQCRNQCIAGGHTSGVCEGGTCVCISIS
jgi:hypothetical protein